MAYVWLVSRNSRGTRSGEVDWLYRTLIGLALFGSNWFALLWVGAPRADLLFWSFLCLFLVCVAWLSLAWLYSALMVLSYSAFTAKKARKEAKVPFARSDVVIVKSEMSLEMQNHAIELMLESMKECTCSADVTKFITGKMREKYGSEWICFISNGKPNPIVLDNQYFLSVYLKMDVVYIELMAYGNPSTNLMKKKMTDSVVPNSSSTTHPLSGSIEKTAVLSNRVLRKQ
ncbi:dynein light chain type 1 domain-containing protein [Ditylenchus destructor]|uniref:Dynein light chain type 1 domain-containing protein n=1 Tax=Ditylenchus destructor TaxID=166010 RepID=A0AAD4MJL8_9BILA|nr:dynein light chain type 1 domain-containing protein [Ditylenchus destructor]